MKVHVEIDCTPEEARSFMGLPDVGKANDVYVEMMSNAMKGVSNTEQLQEYARQLAPMGQAGFKLFCLHASTKVSIPRFWYEEI